MISPQSTTKAKNPIFLDGTYFKVKFNDGHYVSAECVRCKKSYRCTLEATTNLLNHLKSMHPELVAEYEKHKQTSYIPPAKNNRLNDEDDNNETGKRKIEIVSSGRSDMFSMSWQKTADQLVTKVIVDAALPLRIVEVPAFKSMVRELSKMSQPVHCLSTKTVKSNVSIQYEAMKTDILKKLKHAAFVCTTADLWSSHKKSYLGVTVHWVTPTYQRESYAIACMRFKGSRLLRSCQAHQRYGLSAENIIATVTDNGSNLVKCFREFGMELSAESDSESEDSVPDPSEDVVAIDIFSIGDDTETQSEVFSLPNHIRCASHTLSLIATSDIEKAIGTKKHLSQKFSNLHRTALIRCSQLWNYIKRSANRASEAFISKFGRRTRMPCKTRWNSLYDALEDLLKLDPIKVFLFISLLIFFKQYVSFKN